MRDYDGFASLFTQEGVWRIRVSTPRSSAAPRSALGSSVCRGSGTTSCKPRTRGRFSSRATAVGRAYASELGHLCDGRSELNYAVWHNHYERTADGWKFRERVYEIRSIDTAPLTGSAPTERAAS